ncbi:MAG: glycosyltransferase family 9 protein [Planctomycetes bacterium]|nr:glycosyltransferase family 9 protein [Planctomycetota bacterium]
MNEVTINRMKLIDRYLGIPGLLLFRYLKAVFSHPSPAPIEIRKILMVKLWGIGNLVMILPLIHATRRRFPRAEIYFLTLKGNQDLLAPVSELDGILTIQPRGIIKTIWDLVGITRAVRKHRFDLFLDFEQFLKATSILGCLSGAPQTIGFSTPGQARASAFNVKVPYRKNRHMSLGFGDIVRSAGISTDGFPPLQVPRIRAGRVQAEAFLEALPRDRGPLVVLHPGSGDNFPGRRWPVEKFSRLASLLVNQYQACCVLTGTVPERELALQCEREAGVPLINTVGRFDIHGLTEFLARADLLVTNDTAPAHLGSALGVPMVAIFGPNTPEIYGPLHPEHRVFYNPLPCSPCLTNLNAKTSRCRIPSCVLGIEPEAVFKACGELLSRRSLSRDFYAQEGSA